MRGRVLLDDLIDNLNPKRRRSARARVLTGLGLATQMLAHLVPRQQALAPLYQALGALLQPSAGGARQAERMLARIRRLRAKLKITTSEEEADKLHQQIDALTDMLTGSE